MPIPFECVCGKKMSAKEEFAGRRLRCPECQRVVNIPKPGSALIPLAPNQPGSPSSRILIQPNLPENDGAALEVTRPIQQETPPPSKTATFDAAENLDALFAPSMTRTPVLAPPLAPMAPPSPRSGAEPPSPPVVHTPEPHAPTEHPWVDQSLRQIATPWRAGDEQRFQAGTVPARESEGLLGWIVPLLAIAAVLYFAV